MTSSYLRPAILIALAAATLAGCGGKATFEITGTVSGLQYPGLVLVETFSNQTITINDITKTTFAFPNSIEYGTEYNVIVRATPTSGQPAHQNCSPNGGTNGTAGLRTTIDMSINCQLVPHTVGGSITLTSPTGSYLGLKLINGSDNLTPFTVTDVLAQKSYAYPGITFNMPFGISILKQPDDLVTMCKLVPKVAIARATPENVAGLMGDTDIIIDVVCAKP